MVGEVEVVVVEVLAVVSDVVMEVLSVLVVFVEPFDLLLDDSRLASLLAYIGGTGEQCSRPPSECVSSIDTPTTGVLCTGLTPRTDALLEEQTRD